MGISDTSFRLEIKNAVLQAMVTYGQNIHTMDDIAVCLVRNTSDISFITSDDPAILTNRWYLEMPSSKGPSFGLDQSGNIMILPLTPKILFLGYDSHLYTVRSKKGWAEINSASDADAYNEQQILN